MTGAAEATERWTRYWAAGHLHSCPTSFHGFYGPDIQAFWRGRCEGLAADDVVLDLGCGNGGLLRFIRSCMPADRAATLVGVDAAAVLEAAPGDGILLHGKTRFASLPVESGSVSLAVSQYGFEYGDEPGAWEELFRALRGRAGVTFIVHKRGSKLDAVAADESAIATAAVSESGLLAAGEALVPYLVQAATPAGRRELESNPQAAEARARYNAAVDVLANLAELLKHGQYARDILAATADVLAVAQTVAVAESVQRLGRLRDQLRDHLGRIAELRRCALDADGVEAWRARLQGAGFSLPDTQVLREGSYEMGWIVEGRRDA